MELQELIQRLGVHGDSPVYTGVCPVCKRKALMLVELEDGRREIACSYDCDIGDILTAAGLTAVDTLEHIPPLPWAEYEPPPIHQAVEPKPDAPPAWETPRKFEDNILPSFPAECLPAVARNFALAISESVQVSVDMAAVAILAIVALSAQRVFRIRGKDGWNELLSLFCAIFAPPAERKSSVAEIVQRPVIRYEKHANELLQYEIDYCQAEREMIEQELRKAMKGKATVEEVADKRHRLSTMEEKHLLRLWTDNATSEAVVSLMAENNGCIGVISAEPGIFDIMSGRYTSGGSDIEAYLKAHAGDSIRIDRKGRPPEYVSRPAMTMLLFAQPVVLDGIMGNGTFRGRGLTARFLYSIPVSRVGSRTFDTQPIPPAVEEAFERIITELLEMDVPEEEHIIQLDKGAKDTFANYFYELEPRLKGDLEPIGDWAGKLHGTTLRIAGNLHCLLHGNKAAEVRVSEQTMRNAIKIGKYFLDHALAAYRLMGADQTTTDARYILRQLEKEKPQQITRTELTRLCRSKFASAEDMNPAVDLLIEYGYMREGQSSIGYNNRKQITYFINPQVFGINGNDGIDEEDEDYTF